MTKVIDLAGNYTLHGKVLRAKDFEILISERKHPSNKPRLFILHRAPNGQRTYVSSLYPINESNGEYKFDYFAKKYLLHLQVERATIEPLPEKYQSDNIVSLSDLDTKSIPEEGGRI